MEEQGNWKTKIFIVSAILGTLTGLVAAYILVQRAEKNQERPQLSAGEGVKLGLGLMGLLRLVSDMGSEK
jgi:hypothetical protein